MGSDYIVTTKWEYDDMWIFASTSPAYHGGSASLLHVYKPMCFYGAIYTFHLQTVVLRRRLHLQRTVQVYIDKPVSALMMMRCFMNARPSAKSIFSARSLSTATSIRASSLHTPCQPPPTNTSHHQLYHWVAVVSVPFVQYVPHHGR